MRIGIAVSILAAALVTSGCATKGFVRQRTDQLENKVGQLSEEDRKQAARMDQAQKDLEETERDLSATMERVTTVEGHTNEALSRTDRNTRGLDELRQRIANLDDYKLAGETSVLFGFDQDTLTPEARAELDRLAASTPEGKRFFIAVEGFTDPIGSETYNLDLSRRRAERVVRYMVMQHNVPVYRIHVIGLGEQRLLDEGPTREARAKNRRVEVRIFSADSTNAVAARDE
jgi:outer membrane protein OmpA-like peptidoglycan-associated protein